VKSIELSKNSNEFLSLTRVSTGTFNADNFVLQGNACST